MMASLETEVLVIGGGSTGAGVVRDAAMRGFKTVLVERKDLADGTTGRYHGLLHSGGRYAVKDPAAAEECVAENFILRRIASDCIEDTGGLFVSTPWDDPAFGDTFLAGCRATGVPVEEIAVGEALRREPRLNSGISRAFTVADAALDPWKLVWGCARSAQEHGARILPYHRVVGLERDGHRVSGALVHSELTGEDLRIHADVVVNATPLTPQTTNIFDAAFFAKMKPTAYFINIARGQSVVTSALVDALSKGGIAGAGLDVTEPEPLPADHPLWKLPNVIITPHVAATSDLGLDARMEVIKENVRRYASGDRMLSIVDVAKGY